MARPSPGAERVVAVLEYLAAHPDDRFSLSELARGCRLNKATAHALLTELTARGVLLRHPEEKRYSLGPRLIPVGRAAQRGYRVDDFASGVVRRLSAATGTRVVAVGFDAAHDYVTTLEESDDLPRASQALPRRWPLVPPVGVVFFAWADEPSVEAWLARCPAGGSVHHALAGLEAARRDLVSIGAGVPAWWRLSGLLAGGAGQVDDANGLVASVRATLAELARQPALVTEIDPDAVYQPAYVAAPVFDHEGQVVLALVAGCHSARTLRGTELDALASAVRGAAEELTAAVYGRKPQDRP
jgi:DNA-binding IclR family transcriptional regulator